MIKDKRKIYLSQCVSSSDGFHQNLRASLKLKNFEKLMIILLLFINIVAK